MIPRQVAFLGIAALLLAGAGIAAAATYEDDEDTPAALEQPATTTTTSLAFDTTTTVAVSTTTATPATPTTAGRATTTTATTPRQGATTTTRRGATTTTPTGPIAACTTSQLQATVSTDKSTYGIGEPVKIHSRLQNRSSTACNYPSFVFSATIHSPSGQRVTGFDRVNETPGELGAGQANEAFVDWTRVSCTSDICPPNVPGAYTVSATWNLPGGPYTATRTINLT